MGKKSSRPSRAVSKLQDVHKQHLIEFFDENPSAVINDAVESLTSLFEGLEIKKSRVHEFMKDECNLSLKVATLHPLPRNCDANLQRRMEWVQKWAVTDMDFTKNCVFIDESGFHINMRRSRAWSKKGTEAIVPIDMTKAPSHSVIGAISARGVVNMCLRVPLAPKKIKIQGGKKRKAALPKKPQSKGTTTSHYLRFINGTLDVMDKYPEMRNFYLIMDNAPIHRSQEVTDLVEGRNKGYKCVYLPPYSPELNPIEQFWALVKHKVKRNQLMESETLSQRISEACDSVPLLHLVNIIQHSKNHFENCLNKVPI